MIFGAEIHRMLEDGAALMDEDLVIHFRDGDMYRSDWRGAKWKRPASQLYGRVVKVLRWSDAA